MLPIGYSLLAGGPCYVRLTWLNVGGLLPADCLCMRDIRNTEVILSATLEEGFCIVDSSPHRLLCAGAVYLAIQHIVACVYQLDWIDSAWLRENPEGCQGRLVILYFF